jgi:hypothetical protein
MRMVTSGTNPQRGQMRYTVISNHWTPLHRGNIGPWTDAEVMRLWGPPIVKIVWDGNKPPYLNDIPAGAKLLWRNYPLSEEFNSGFDLGAGRGLAATAEPVHDTGITSANGLPQNGSGRDQAPPATLARAVAALPTPEQAAQVYVDNAVEVAAYCATQGFGPERLIFCDANEFPVWAFGYTGLARMQKRKLQLMHKALPKAGNVEGDLGVGWPGNVGPDTPPVWDWFADVAAEFGPYDYLGTHEYTGFGGPVENWGWWTGRILKCPYRVPILITECLVDGGVYGAEHAKQGYRNYPGLNSEDAKALRYQDELWTYAKAVSVDGRVRGIMPYTYDGNHQDWSNFDIRTETFLRPFLARIASQGLPQPAPFPAPAVKTLAEALAAAFGSQFSDLHASLPHHATLKYATRPTANITRLVLHHTATPQTTTWQTVATYHVNSKDWPGIGYHIGVHVDGQVALLNTPETISYHCGDASKPGDENADSLAIAVMGNFESDPVPPLAWTTAQQVADVVRAFLGRNVPMIGHRDVAGDTVCPGKNLYALLKAPAPVTLPEQEPVMAVGLLADKCRYWLEESVRQDEAGNAERAKAIRYSLIKLFYRLENALKAGKPTG